MGKRRRFEEFGAFALGVNDAERIEATKLWGFPNHIVLRAPHTYLGGSLFAKVKIWLPDNTEDDYLYLTETPPPRVMGEPLLAKTMHFCFANHRDAVNLKFRWG